MAIELTTATTSQLSGIRQSLAIGSLLQEVFPEAIFRTNGAFAGSSSIEMESGGSYANVKPLKNFKNLVFGRSSATSITSIINASYLTNLENFGTGKALDLESCNLGTAALNQLFTDLPVTTKTATIDIRSNPGAATCNTSIATAKGYTVVTS